MGIRGLAERKRVVTQSISPSALISMSTVKLPPMSRLGEERKRGRAIQGSFFLCHQTATKIWPLHRSTGKTAFISSVWLTAGGCHVGLKLSMYLCVLLTEGNFFREHSIESLISSQSLRCTQYRLILTQSSIWAVFEWIKRSIRILRERRY